MKRRNFLQGLLGAAAGLFGSVATPSVVVAEKAVGDKLIATAVDGNSFSLIGNEEIINPVFKGGLGKYDNIIVSPGCPRPRFVKSDREKQSFGVLKISTKGG